MPVPDPLDLAELKRRVDVQLATNDPLLTEYLEAAFEQAQAPPPHGTGRLLLPDPADDTDPEVQKRIRANGSRFVRVPDARVISEVLADDVVIGPDDYEVLERQEHIVRLELPRRCRVAKITGRFGFAALPAALRDAIYVLAARGFYEREANYADQIAVAEGAAVQAYFRQIPPRTKLVFASYTVPSDLWGLA